MEQQKEGGRNLRSFGGSHGPNKITGGSGKIKATAVVGAELFVSLCFTLVYFPNTVSILR